MRRRLSQKLATRTEEEVERETYSVPRHLKPPPPGTRPGLLTEPVPQVRLEAAALASVVDGLPTFALPVLAGSAGEATDSGSLSFLVRQTLSEREKQKRKEEEENEVAKHTAV